MPNQSLLDITATPAADQNILHEGKEYTTVKEGLAYILVPATASKVPQTTPKGDNKPQSVFYNPIQQFNRDLSVLAIKAYGEQVLAKHKESSERHHKKILAKKNKKRKRGEEGSVDGSVQGGGNGEHKVATESKTPTNTEQTTQVAVEDEAASKRIKTFNGESKLDTDGNESIVLATKPLDETVGTQAEGEEKTEKPRKFHFTILDALSATGLRALRYSQEIPFTTSITANDLLPEATKSIQLNVKHNKLEEKITAVTGNALTHMYSLIGDDCKDEKGKTKPSRKYNVIDLDPYGTAAPFLDAAVQSVRDDGGLLCVTCTDAGVWASNGYPEKSYSLYGGTPTKGEQSHEGGLRLILHAIASSAARYGLAIEPLLSLSIDFYARVFVRIYKSPADVKFLAGKTMMVYNCDTGCGAWTTQMVARNKLTENKKGDPQWKHTFSQGPTSDGTCEHCGFKTHIAGPMYAGPIQSAEFITKILKDLPNVSKDTYQTTPRIEGMLTTALHEIFPQPESSSPTATSKTNKYDPAALDPAPFLFIPSALARVVHCITPVENSFRGALRHLGYQVTRSHTKPGSIKTDAPWSVIWEIMREWVRQKHPVKESSIREGTAGHVILGLSKKKQEAEVKADMDEKKEGNDTSAEKKIEVVFDDKLGAEKDTKKIVRYQINPRENWGPMARAKGPVQEE